jgi:RNA polymerase sigma factor FliA
MNAVASQQTTATAAQEVVMAHYPMVRAIACRIYKRLPKGVDLDDLISTGVMGLLEAVDRYDETRKVPFETYAKHRIRGSIVDSLRASDWVPRSVRRKAELISETTADLTKVLGRTPSEVELAEKLQTSPSRLTKMRRDAQIQALTSLDVPTATENHTPLVEQITNGSDMLKDWEDLELKEELLAAIKKLPDRERTSIALYYLHEMSLKEVGQVLGVTESRAYQLCGQGIKRLRKKLGSNHQ